MGRTPPHLTRRQLELARVAELCELERHGRTQERAKRLAGELAHDYWENRRPDDLARATRSLVEALEGQRAQLRKEKQRANAESQGGPIPPIFRCVIDGFLECVNPAIVEGAYETAAGVLAALNQDPKAQQSAVSQYVEQTAGAELLRYNPALIEEGSDVRRFGGDVQNAFMEPSFCLGFALAYRLFAGTVGLR